MAKQPELKMYYRGENVPIYCVECGTKLKTKDKFSKFDKLTGNKLFKTELYCPNYIFFCHWKVKFDENGYELLDFSDYF